MTTASATFSINSTTCPAEVSTTYGATATLALISVTDVNSVTWSIVGTSGSSIASPTITPSGTPATGATFTIGSDQGDGAGVAYGVKCVVRDAYGGTYTAYGIVGVPNAAGAIPGVAGEELWRHATHGYLSTFNSALMGFPHTSWSATSTGSDVATAATVNIPPSKLMRISSLWSAFDATGSDRLIRESTAYFENIAGTATQIGSTADVINTEDDATWSTAFTATGSDVKIQYSGDATNSTSWRGFVWTMKPGN